MDEKENITKPKKVKVPTTLESTVPKDTAVHVLLRIKSEDGQTINAHRSIIKAKGSAILGKIGQALSPTFIVSLNKQIAQDVETFLFLTTRDGWNGPYVTYQCRLKRVEAQLVESKSDLVPKYYSAEYKNIKTWFEISTMEMMSKAQMDKIFVLSSGRSIMSVIKSSATVFRVALESKSASPSTPT